MSMPYKHCHFNVRNIVQEKFINYSILWHLMFNNLSLRLGNLNDKMMYVTVYNLIN